MTTGPATLLRAADSLGDARSLIEAAFMAAGSLDMPEAADALQAVLQIALERLDAVKGAIASAAAASASGERRERPRNAAK